MRSTIRMALAALAVILPLSACSSGGSGLPLLESAKTDDANYRLGPGDKLHIQVLGAEDLTGDYAVFYIYGEVTKPGEYPYASGMRVMSAVATAGGFTYRANEGYVVVTRNGEQHRALLNTPIQPDDVIRVPERYF